MPQHTPENQPARLDTTCEPPHVWLDLIGQSYLERGLTREAIKVLQMNVEAYPKSPGAHASLGRAYERCGDAELAAMSFRRAADLNTG